MSPELDSTMAAASTGLVFGLFLGGIPASKAEYNNFIDRNKASQFESHFEAKVWYHHLSLFISCNFICITLIYLFL